jgi:hypothetical protein
MVVLVKEIPLVLPPIVIQRPGIKVERKQDEAPPKKTDAS